MRSTLFAALTLLFIAAPAAASAQMLGALDESDPFTISVTPQYPRPRSEAVVSVLSNTVNLVNSTMIVKLDGKEVYRGNAAPVSIPVGSTGSVAEVGITIAAEGKTYARNVSIQPQDVILVPEPVSSAPVLYKGKPLVPEEGSVRMVAFANLRTEKGVRAAPSSLSYSWTVDGMKIANGSGIGKSALAVASPLLYRSRSVSVDVTDASGELVGGASLSLSPAEPVLRLYENDPLLGIRFDRALAGTYAIEGSEAAFYAAPFSFSTIGGTASVQWFVNGSAVETGPLITVRPTGSGQGSASLSAVASAEMQKASANLPLSFGSSGFNFFGL